MTVQYNKFSTTEATRPTESNKEVVTEEPDLKTLR